MLTAGDVRNKDRLRLAMQDVDIVFHLASMRHIDMCDRYVSESTSISVEGTRNVAELCLELDIPKAIFTSSAEAVYPTNVYGCGKYIAERIFYQSYLQHNRDFVITRFGNVLGGHGSIIPKVCILMKEGKTVKLTHPEMRRRILTIPMAAEQLLQCMYAPAGTIIISSLPLARIADIITVAGELLGIEPDIEITQPRADEKMENLMLTEEEKPCLYEWGDYLIINPASPSENPYQIDDKGLLTKQELSDILRPIV